MRRPVIAMSILALAFPILAACGSTGGTESGGIPSNSPSPAQPTQSATAAPAKCVKKFTDVPTASAKYGQVPNISKPTGNPPCELYVKDLKVGKGKAVSDTSKTYKWNYEGVSWSNGQIFDSSFARGAAVPFALNQVIPGWTTGLDGMKPGGRRMLVIPPEQGYGEAGNGTIGPNETLVFVVDLVGPAS